MEILADYPLQRLNTFGLSVFAHRFARARSIEDLREALEHARHASLPMLVLGGGSNLVLTKDYPGLVIRIELSGIETERRADEIIRLRVAAGEDWPTLVDLCLGQGWYGLENLALIPGSAGAAPIQNIGAYGVELSDRLVEFEALERETGQLVRFSKAQCRFGYRDSAFKTEHRDRYVITSITLELSREPAPDTSYEALARELEAAGIDRPTPRDVHEAVCRLRLARLPDPAVLGNAGSFFANPVIEAERHRELKERFGEIAVFEQPDGRVKLAAGWLIERCGFKGIRADDAGVFEKQALVLVNHGRATGRDILELAARIQTKVRDTFGVDLEIEPRVV